MKKFALALLFASIAGSAMAGDNWVSLGYKFEDNLNGANRNGYQFQLGSNVHKNLAIDVAGENLYTDGNGSNTSRIEGAVTPKYDIGSGFSVYTRGAVGQKYLPGDNFSYYSVEPGVKYAVSDAFAVKAGYRFRNAFDSDKNADLTRTYRLGGEYAITKETAVSVNFDRADGDSRYNGVTAAYTIKF
jgi:hypothetical protein